jgi:hypothetical protein
MGKALHEIMFLVEEAPEGAYIARASDDSIFTEADDLENLEKQIHDAVNCHFDKGEKLPTIRWVFERPARVAYDA